MLRRGKPSNLSTPSALLPGLGEDARAGDGEAALGARGVREDCGLGGNPVLECALRKFADAGLGASGSRCKCKFVRNVNDDVRHNSANVSQGYCYCCEFPPVG